MRPWSAALPDARGPKEGLAVPSPAAAAAAEWPASPMLAKARTEAREFYDREAGGQAPLHSERMLVCARVHYGQIVG